LRVINETCNTALVAFGMWMALLYVLKLSFSFVFSSFI